MLIKPSICCSQVQFFFYNLSSLQTLQGSVVELVKEYKYLGIIVDDVLSFSSHITQLKKKLRIKLGFYFRNKFCFSFNVRKKLVTATFLPVLDYGDVVYQFAPSSILSRCRLSWCFKIYIRL